MNPASGEPAALGIDAGGTRTRAVLVDGEARVLSRGEGGPGNPRDVGVEGLVAAVAAVLEEIGPGATAARSVFAGVAGVATEEERNDARRALATLWPEGVALRVDSDLVTAHAGAFGRGAGVVLVAGTGSAAFAKDASGREARAGGFGPVLDDRGGATGLALAGLRAVLLSIDGRGPETALRADLEEGLGAAGPRPLVDLAAGIFRHRDRIAALAPRVLACAESGDAVARAIVGEGADELARAAAAAALRCGLEAPRLALVGGLVERSTFYRAALGSALRRRLPDLEIRAVERPPAEGAALLALGAL